MAERKWQFKTKFRAKSYGWRGSRLAISRLKEAFSEIKAAAKSDPVAGGDGAVSLMERIWPAFQDIDTSSGALGTAVARTLDKLIPILIDAPADHSTRSKWLTRLFEAVQNDGVEYLAQVEGQWGEIARYPDLINEYADRLIGIVRRACADPNIPALIGTSICLSCLLEAGRYAELQELLSTRRMKFWSSHWFGAEALVRQGLWEAAVAYAEGVRSDTKSGYREISIDRFCEDLLIRHGRSDEAYRRYGLRVVSGTTNLAIYRSLVRTYPDRDHWQMLLDLIETHGDKGQMVCRRKRCRISRHRDASPERGERLGPPKTVSPAKLAVNRVHSADDRSPHRRRVATRDQARWLPGHRPQGRRPMKTRNPSGMSLQEAVRIVCEMHTADSDSPQGFTVGFGVPPAFCYS